VEDSWLDVAGSATDLPSDAPSGQDGHRAGGPAGGRSALAAFDPGRRGLRALLVVAAVVAVVAGYLFWRGQPHVEPAPAVAPPLGASAASSVAGTIVIAVTGRVAHPGLVRLPAGARVQDAIEAAGGILPGTDISFLNLARKLNDGELLVIGVTPPPGPAPDSGNGAPVDGKVNINTATLAQLDALPGIGPALAQRIIDYRTAHGGFHSVDELRKVEGIGDAKYAEIKDRVTV
jgi:competence protein ComEA